MLVFLVYVQELIADNFGILAHIQALLANDYVIFNTLGKIKYLLIFELQTFGIISRHSTNFATKLLKKNI